MDAKPVSTADLVTAGIERHEAKWLLEEFAGLALENAVTRRLAGEPLQYVIGHWPFRSLDLLVDSRALIPRPESEELVTRALQEVERAALTNVKLMDLGCGTGAIGFAMYRELTDRGVSVALTSVDLSPDALSLAKENGVRCGIENVTFVESSWFTAVDEGGLGSFDLITANPPYVGEVEFATLDPILHHEPLMAIVSPTGDEVPGFKDLAEIISQAPQWLTQSGVLVSEHADIHRDAVLGAAAKAGFAWSDDFDDLAGKPRTLIARMK